MTKRMLLASHDAGGTVPPMLALAEALVDRGHEVDWLGQSSIEPRARAVGCRFSAFADIPNYESRRFIEEQFSITMPVITGAQVGEELASAARRQDNDLIVVDANLAGAAAAAEALDQPSAVLLHSMYKTFIDTWFAELWPFLGSAINETRAHFGLSACECWADVFAGHDRVLSVVPERFDAPVLEQPFGMRHFGFLVPRTPPTTRTATFPDGDAPAVLVGLSTTYQQQEHLLQVILDALGGLEVRGLASTGGQVDPRALRCPANVVVREFVDHGAVLADTDVMVTHAGLGSVAAALSRGVPLVCTPIGRDQHLNTERVVALGAGPVVAPDPGAADVAEALQAVVAEHSYRDAAVRISHESRQAGGPTAAVEDLEGLLR